MRQADRRPHRPRRDLRGTSTRAPSPRCTPTCPRASTGANEALKDLYGDGNGAPDADKAAARARGRRHHDAGRHLDSSTSAEHYGPSSSDEYAIIKDSSSRAACSRSNLQSTEWVQYSKDRVADLYPAYQLGWFPDYSDADNYLTPFFLTENFLVEPLRQPRGERPDPRAGRHARTPRLATALIGEIQDKVAADLSTIPYMQGAQVAVVGSDVEGAEDTLDASFKFRYGALSKG